MGLYTPLLPDALVHGTSQSNKLMMTGGSPMTLETSIEYVVSFDEITQLQSSYNPKSYILPYSIYGLLSVTVRY